MADYQRKLRKSWRWNAALAAVLSMGLFVGCSDDDDKKADNNQVQTDAGHDDGISDDAGDVTEITGVQIPGLSAPVKVQFDAQGVLHIDCMTDQDCYAAQGYFHAGARFFEMDLIRRQTRGQISELIGGLGVSMDKQFRQLNTTAEGVPLEQAYYDATGDSAKEMLNAYAAGVNAWLADMRAKKNDATLTAEYDHPLLTGVEIRDWEPQDTIALYLQLAYQLSETASDDLFRGEMATLLSPEVAADIFTVKPGVASDIIQASETPSNLLKTDLSKPQNLEAMRQAQARLAPAASVMAKARERLAEHHSFVFGPKNGEDGSNNWVLAPALTKNGGALLANDPHLSLNTPAIWYYVELDSKTNGNGNLHVVGASIPAVPGVIVGHNEEIAWGVTTARMDLADAYIETLSADGKSVIFNGNEVEIIEKDFTFKVKGAADETHTFEYVPHHGPIIERDDDNNVAVSIRWVLQEPGNDLDFIEQLMTSTTTQGAMDSLAPVRAINQNWVIMDLEGNIGWNPKVAIPNRPWASSAMPNWLPLPGDGSAEWDGYLAAADSPSLYNPASKFIATANNDMDGSYTDGDSTNDGHSPWQTTPAAGHRHKRIVDLIVEGGNEHTVETMTEIQADTYIIHGEVLVPHFLDIANNAAPLDAKSQSVVDALANWEYTCPTGLVGEGLEGKGPKTATNSTDPFETKESMGCAAFHVMLPYLTAAIFDDEVNENVPGGQDSNFDVLANWSQLQSALLYVFDDPSQLNKGEDYFDNVKTTGVVETREDIVLENLANTADRLNALFSTLVDKPAGQVVPDDWRWGRIHTVKLVSLVSMGGFTIAEVGPFINDGGLYSVDVANPMGRGGDFNGSFRHPHGASLRAIYEVTEDGIKGVFQLPGGQDHHQDSPFYNSLLDDWLLNKNNPLLFERAEVDQAAVETIMVNPTP
ncbi:penicillin acylase family protein [Bradymonas sediminis]|uniref:Uncharacterized protein n=1 Tax=Bradymonas sediminis TaxID=1548548 RepID=A0A2Z4FGT8_9DELT|nr:penicillin acylase family protein [Bradymonas sediminis]AWV88187.1 hypothetical protein DN745_02075 [Bradymonas sediminis]TDP77311.1 penicillin amidase [Bradymonas sediminis]